MEGKMPGSLVSKIEETVFSALPFRFYNTQQHTRRRSYPTTAAPFLWRNRGRHFNPFHPVHHIVIGDLFPMKSIISKGHLPTLPSTPRSPGDWNWCIQLMPSVRRCPHHSMEGLWEGQSRHKGSKVHCVPWGECESPCLASSLQGIPRGSQSLVPYESWLTGFEKAVVLYINPEEENQCPFPSRYQHWGAP